MPAKALCSGFLVTLLLAAASGCQRPEILTQSLPDAVVGVAYSYQLEAKETDNRWSVAAGTLPPGIGMNSLGKLSGTPTLAGVFLFTVQVSTVNSTETIDRTASQGLSLSVR